MSQTDEIAVQAPGTITVDTADLPADTIRALAIQPVSAIRWMRPDRLRANNWNPNRQAPPEKRLLKISLLEDGWTQPIVIGEDDEIVDGYHRWMLACHDPEVSAMTGGLVPVTRLHGKDGSERRMSTIRHNRARGTHHVVKMADIVNDLAADGIDEAEIGRRLQMDREEVTRLLQRGNMLQRGAGETFNAGWEPTREETWPAIPPADPPA